MNIHIIFLFSAPHVVFCFTVFFFASLVPHFFCCILKISFVRFVFLGWFQVTFNVSLMCQAILMNMQTWKVEKHKGQKTESAKDRFILNVWYSFTAWPKTKSKKKKKKKKKKCTHPQKTHFVWMYKFCFNWLSNSATCITTPVQFWQQHWTPWPCPFDRRLAQFTCQMSQVHCLPWAERSVCHFWLSDEDGSVKILVSKVVVGLRCGMQIINNNDNFCRALFSNMS